MAGKAMQNVSLVKDYKNMLAWSTIESFYMCTKQLQPHALQRGHDKTNVKAILDSILAKGFVESQDLVGILDPKSPIPKRGDNVVEMGVCVHIICGGHRVEAAKQAEATGDARFQDLQLLVKVLDRGEHSLLLAGDRLC